MVSLKEAAILRIRKATVVIVRIVMLQAEVGSAKVTATGAFPGRGHLFPDFSLPSALGRVVSPQEFRGQSNLILVFAGEYQHPAAKGLVAELSAKFSQIREDNTEVLLIVTCSPEQASQIRTDQNLPFPLLVDEDGHVHKLIGIDAEEGTAVFVADRFLEVAATWSGAKGESLPGAPEILSWLEFLESQCPECTQAEWPADS